MSPQGDLIQLSPSCNGRYINPKGGSSRPRCQPFLQKLQHWTNRVVNWVNCTSQTPRLKNAPLGRVQLPSSGGSDTGYGFLNFGRQSHQSQSSITALGPVWAIPTTSRVLVEDARSWAIPTTSRVLVEDARSCPEAGTVSPA